MTKELSYRPRYSQILTRSGSSSQERCEIARSQNNQSVVSTEGDHLETRGGDRGEEKTNEGMKRLMVPGAARRAKRWRGGGPSSGKSPVFNVGESKEGKLGSRSRTRSLRETRPPDSSRKKGDMCLRMS